MRIPAILLLLSGTMTSGTMTSTAAAQPFTMQVRAAPASTLRWMGLGVEVDPYEFPPTAARWHTIEQRLTFMRSGFFRVMLNATDYCTGYGEDGKPRYVWQSNDVPEHPQFESLLRILDYAQAHGVRILLGQWSPPGRLGIHTPADPRWAAMQADLIAYLIQQRHIDMIRDAIFFNEPNGQWMWRGSQPDFTAWSTGVRNLRLAMDARGLQSIAIAGPDNSGDTAWFDRSVAEDHALFGAWESHIYATNAEVDQDQIEQQLRAQSATIVRDDPNGATKDRFIAESGLRDGKIEVLDQQPRVRTFAYGVRMAAYVAEVARAGWLGACAWDLDDAMHGNGHGGLKLWGFWNSSTAEGMMPRPWFYLWSIVSRSMPAGSTLEAVNTPGSTADSLFATAATWKGGGTAGETVLLINNGSVPMRLQIDDSRLHGTVRVFDYVAGRMPANPHTGFAMAASTMSGVVFPIPVDLPPQSVVVLTTIS